jgi:D-amino peptidase
VRVLVSVDMEGIGGVVAGDELRPGEAEWERSRHLMTAEASAAVRGVLTHAPDAEVVVTDAHGNFRNILPEKLDRRARLIRGKPKPDGMLSGLGAGVAAVLFVGYHGKVGTATSVLAHTIHGAVIADVRCDGRSLGELGLNAALTAHHGAVPVLAAGDDTVAAEAAEVAPGISTVVVKRAVGYLAAECLHPDEACALIEAAVPVALERRADVRPVRFDGPVSLEVDVHGPSMVENALLVPGVERAGPRTLRYAAPDFPSAYRLVCLFALLGTPGG